MLFLNYVGIRVFSRLLLLHPPAEVVVQSWDVVQHHINQGGQHVQGDDWKIEIYISV